jgi:hemerythrin-like metal-binding protein
MATEALHSALADSKGINREHMVQARLMQALSLAVEKGEGVGDTLVQLSDYSRTHFLSEEVLMRLYSYKSYEAHKQDHERMVEWLDELFAKKGEQVAMAHAIQELIAIFLRHIGSHDVYLHDFLGELST